MSQRQQWQVLLPGWQKRYWLILRERLCSPASIGCHLVRVLMMRWEPPADLPKTHTEAIARSINRAAKLADGAKIYIPAIGQDHVPDEARLSAGIAAFININTASQSELESLTGIGLVTAGKIISGRPFLRLEELVEKKAMSQSLFDKLKDQLTL